MRLVSEKPASSASWGFDDGKMVVHKPLVAKHAFCCKTWWNLAIYPPSQNNPSHLLPCGGRQATHFCTRVLVDKGVIPTQPSMVYNLIHTGNQPSMSPNSLSLLSSLLNSIKSVCFVAVSRFYSPSCLHDIMLSKVSCVSIEQLFNWGWQSKTRINKTMIWYNVQIVYFTFIEHDELMLHLFLQKHVEQTVSFWIQIKKTTNSTSQIE